ncbi:MAG TPA: glycosyltransferase family 2 protein [Chthoniobacterales bacterium]|nr:glycosyltransferase family 2 protein [Chthoniobacterales bacterium]
MNSAELIAVMPVYNEEANIAAVITEWLQAFAHQQINARLLAVNDGSRDNTLSILRKLQSQYPDQLLILDKPNSGHGRSCRVGYEATLQQETPWILQIDSDGQCDPAFFVLFWAKRDEADCIFGIRVTRDDGLVRKLVSKAASILTSIMTGQNLKDANVPYRLVKHAALKKALPSVPKDFDIQNIALTLALKRDSTLRWSYVPIRFRARQGGTNSINLLKIVQKGFRMLRQINRVGS